VEDAAAFLIEEKDKKDTIRNNELLSEERRRAQRRYGPTANGGLLDLQKLEILKEMSYSEEIAVEALKQMDNDMNEITSALTDPQRLEILEQAIIAKHKKKEEKEYKALFRQNVKVIVEMGFSKSLAKGTLKQSKNDLDAAISLLMDGKGVEEVLFEENVLETVSNSNSNLSLDPFAATTSQNWPPNLETLMDEMGNNEIETKATDENVDMSISPLNDSTQKQEEPEPLDTEEQIKKREELRRKREEERLARELEHELTEAVELLEEDYVNVTLDDESSVLVEYKSRLEKDGKWN